MGRVIMAALAYWVAVFAPAFALGVVRTLWLAPQIGALAAVAVEVPIVLAISWFAARVAVRRWRLGRGEAAAMGACAFALLMLAEWGLALRFGQSSAGWLVEMMTTPGMLGLAGQVGFAGMPWFFTRRCREGNLV